jgi:hypothetical protein
MQEAYPAFKYMCTDSSIAVAPKNVIDEHGAFLNNRRYNKNYGLPTASLPLSLKLLILWLPQMLSLDMYFVFSFAYMYAYVGNNPLKYRDPTGHFPLISWDRFVSSVNAYKASQRNLKLLSSFSLPV